jgi:hypothetical protein
MIPFVLQLMEAAVGMGGGALEYDQMGTTVCESGCSETSHKKGSIQPACVVFPFVSL